MIEQRPRPVASVLILSILAVAALGGATAGALTTPRGDVTRPESPRTVAYATPLARRLGAIDEALGRRDVGGAIREWRDVYGVALGARRWEAMVTLGDAALRIDGAAGRPVGRPTGFRAEARQAYLRALFLARSAGSAEGVERVALAFATLGDTEMAARARTIVVSHEPRERAVAP